MAHKKAGGSTRLGRDSQPKYLGVKVGAGQLVNAGMVLVRQKGSRIHAGKNVKAGHKDTLYAALPGRVDFQQKKRQRFDGSRRHATMVNVIPADAT